MKILVTGANGFIGKNLLVHLKENDYEAIPFDKGDSIEKLRDGLREADFVAHLAGVNRPLTEAEFMDGNVNLTRALLGELRASGRRVPLFFSSSTQAERDTPYGTTKRMAEEEILRFAAETGCPAYVYRLCNVYGKWCRPNYNSVVATWCHNLTRGLPIEVNEKAPPIEFVYVDDVCGEIVSLIREGGAGDPAIRHVEPRDRASLRDVASLLESYARARESRGTPDVGTPFKAKLYATFLSYYPEGDLSYGLSSHADARGSFTEFLRGREEGQLSVNVINPGVTKGNHYHHTKNEKFLVVSGECETSFRCVGGGGEASYRTGGGDLRVVDVPPGYAHCITNVGEGPAVVLMWASEPFDPARPDTYPMEVKGR